MSIMIRVQGYSNRIFSIGICKNFTSDSINTDCSADVVEAVCDVCSLVTADLVVLHCLDTAAVNLLVLCVLYAAHSCVQAPEL